MNCLKDHWAIHNQYEAIAELDDYHYEEEKLVYLFPCHQIENVNNEDFSFIDEVSGIDFERMQEVLDKLENSYKNGVTQQELRLLSKK